MKQGLSIGFSDLALIIAFGLAAYMFLFMEVQNSGNLPSHEPVELSVSLPALPMSDQSNFQAVFSSPTFGQQQEVSDIQNAISAFGTISTPEGQLAIVRIEGELAPTFLAVGQSVGDWTLQSMNHESILLSNAYQRLRIPFKANRSNPYAQLAPLKEGSDEILGSVMDILKASTDDN